jgi:hypothetical protein
MVMKTQTGRVRGIGLTVLALALSQLAAGARLSRDAVSPFSEAAVAPEVVETISFPLDTPPAYIGLGFGVAGSPNTQTAGVGNNFDFRFGYRWNRWFSTGASIAAVGAGDSVAGYRLGLDWNLTLIPRRRHQLSVGLSPVFGHFGTESFAFSLSGRRDNGIGAETRVRYDFRIDRRFRIGAEVSYAYFWSPALERFSAGSINGLHIPRFTAVLGLDL